MKTQYAFHEIKIINLKFDAKSRINYYRYLTAQLFKKINTIMYSQSFQFSLILFYSVPILYLYSNILFFSYLFV